MKNEQATTTVACCSVARRETDGHVLCAPLSRRPLYCGFHARLNQLSSHIFSCHVNAYCRHGKLTVSTDVQEMALCSP